MVYDYTFLMDHKQKKPFLRLYNKGIVIFLQRFLIIGYFWQTTECKFTHPVISQTTVYWNDLQAVLVTGDLVEWRKEKHLPLPLSSKARETVTLLPYFRPRGPLTWLDPGAFGTLGVGGGFALGAKLCRPDSEVWIIYGDGSLGYSVAEFDTFTRHKVGLFCSIHLFPQNLTAMCWFGPDKTW